VPLARNQQVPGLARLVEERRARSEEPGRRLVPLDSPLHPQRLELACLANLQRQLAPAHLEEERASLARRTTNLLFLARRVCVFKICLPHKLLISCLSYGNR
jgi:hypothetical protein